MAEGDIINSNTNNDNDPGELPCIKLCRNSGKDKLDLCSNNLYCVPNGVADLTHLQYLYLEGNLIQEIPSNLCENLKHLIWFDIRRNELKSLPENISLLERLKHFLLEGNKLEELPAQLGDLINLRALNLRYNPLRYPPKEIIGKGTKEILRYLREHKHRPPEDKKEHHSGEESPEETEALHIHIDIDEDDKEAKKSEKTHQYPVGYYANDIDISDDYRRLSLEENMLQLLRYSVNSLDLKQRKTLARYSLPALKKKNLKLEPLKQVRKSKGASEEERKLSYTRREPLKSTRQREIDRAAKRKFNEKTYQRVQSLKDKRMLNDWRRKSGPNSEKSSDRKHEIVIPYGHDVLSPIATIEKANTPAKDDATNRNINDQGQSNISRISLDEQLEKRIKEHVQNIKNWRRNHHNDLISLDEQLSVTTQNLEKAQALQKQLQEKRAKEYRFRAFTGGDFVPPSHSIPAGKN